MKKGGSSCFASIQQSLQTQTQLSPHRRAWFVEHRDFQFLGDLLPPRERFFEILNRLKKQIWIPYQATYEYQKNASRFE
jgi:hypothetical protein